jgi:hypothetical protein
MDDMPNLSPADATLLLNVEVRRRIAEVLVESLPQRARANVSEMDSEELKAAIRVGVSALIVEVMLSPEFVQHIAPRIEANTAAHQNKVAPLGKLGGLW